MQYMTKLFLSTSFSGHISPQTKAVLSGFRAEIEAILTSLRAAGFTVFCAVEDENWVILAAAPEVGVDKDLGEIDAADVVLALLPSGMISAGLQYEMGYAEAKGKLVIAAARDVNDLGYFNLGAVNAGRIKLVIYTDLPSLSGQVMATINGIK